jgi:small glutamine-rich tetratricopeptide repeat-containing protein alpha
MQNPMMRQMAQSLMSNPDMMNNLMGSLGGAGRGGGGGGGGMGLSITKFAKLDH